MHVLVAIFYHYFFMVLWKIIFCTKLFLVVFFEDFLCLYDLFYLECQFIFLCSECFCGIIIRNSYCLSRFSVLFLQLVQYSFTAFMQLSGVVMIFVISQVCFFIVLLPNVRGVYYDGLVQILKALVFLILQDSFNTVSQQSK